MKIQDRIALYFTLISMFMLLSVLCTVYFTFMKFLEADFFDRITDRTTVTAKLYLEADEISSEALITVRQKYLQKLNGEVTRIYDSKDNATFIGDTAQYWSKNMIRKVRSVGRVSFKEGLRQVVGIYYKDNQGDFVIIASAIDESSHNRLDKLLKIMVVIFVLITIALLLSGRWIAKKMLLPLHHFTTDVKKVGSTNLGFRVTETNNKDEINLLAHSFNKLMEELEQAFILQRTFVSNASHELRTPVTRMMMTTELALSKEREKQDYQTVLNSVLEDTIQMDHIITGLLTLAKMDLELINSQLSPVNLNELLLKIKTEWSERLGLQLELVNVNDTPVAVLASPTLLQIALDNIISNAFKFSDQQHVECVLDCQSHQVVLHIKDKGTGIATADRQDIFNPFYSKSRESGHQGEGMGLYMASKIIDLFKGTIEVSPNKPVGSIFSITLPKL